MWSVYFTGKPNALLLKADYALTLAEWPLQGITDIALAKALLTVSTVNIRNKKLLCLLAIYASLGFLLVMIRIYYADTPGTSSAKDMYFYPLVTLTKFDLLHAIIVEFYDTRVKTVLSSKNMQVKKRSSNTKYAVSASENIKR
jgi:hypothetical protein